MDIHLTRSRIGLSFVYLAVLLLLQGCPGGSSQPGQGSDVPADAPRVVTFSKSFGGPGFDEARAAIATSDGGYVFVGSIDNSREGADDGNLWITKLDALGDVQWQRSIGEPRTQVNDATHTRAFSMVRALPDGSYVLTGTATPVNDSSTTGNDIWVAKLSATGTIEWSRDYDTGTWREGAFATAQFGRGAFSDDEGTDIWPVNDGGFVVAGRSRANLLDSDNRVHIDTQSAIALRIGANGDLIRRHRLTEGALEGEDHQLSPPIIRATADGDAVLSYTYDPRGRGTPSVARIARLGVGEPPVWDRYEDGGVEGAPPRVYDIIPVADDGFVVALGAPDADGPVQRSRTVLLKLGANGGLLWSRTLVNTNLLSLDQACEPPSGSAVVCELLVGGQSTLGQRSARIMRLSSQGTTLAEATVSRDDLEGLRVDALAVAPDGVSLVAAVRVALPTIHRTTEHMRRVVLDRHTLAIVAVSADFEVPEVNPQAGLGFSEREHQWRFPLITADGAVLSINPAAQSFTRWRIDATSGNGGITPQDFSLEERFVGETAHGVVEVSPDSYIVTGESLTFEDPGTRALHGVASLLALRVTGGRVDWLRRYGRADHRPDPARGIVAPSGDGGVVVLPRYFHERMLMKIAGDGSIAWQSAPLPLPLIDPDFVDVQRLPDGGFVLLGGFGRAFSSVYRFDATGTLSWHRDYDLLGADSIIPIDEDDDGAADDGFILGADAGLATVVNLDADGVVRWRKEFTARGAEPAAPRVWKIQPLASGYVLGTSETGVLAPDVVGQPFGQGNVLLLGLSRAGELRWSRSYGAFLGEKLFDLRSTNDGFIVAGSSRSFGDGTEAWLMRLDPDGLLSEGCNAHLASPDTLFAVESRALTQSLVTLDPVAAASPAIEIRALSLPDRAAESVVARQCSGTFTPGATSPARVTLTVVQPGTQRGVVVSTPAGIVCGAEGEAGCSASLASGQDLFLDVDPGSVAAFLRWEDCDSIIADGSGSARCQVRMTRNRQVRAIFGAPRDRFELRLTVNGEGSVTSGDGGIRCGVFFGAGQDCEQVYDATQVGSDQPNAIDLAVFNNRDAFTGWGGDCAAAGTASAFNLTLDSDKACTATFADPQFALEVAVTGAGEVLSSDQRIRCRADGGDCRQLYTPGASVGLRFDLPDSGATFLGWGGDCAFSGSEARSAVIMDGPKRCTATFSGGTSPARFPLTVQKVGFAAAVVSLPPGIDCGAVCSADFPSNQPVRLSVTPVGGGTLSGWTGCDRLLPGTTAAFDCEVDMTATRTVQVRIE